MDFLFLVLIGCTGETKTIIDIDNGDIQSSDANGDGYITDEACDDSEAEIHPAAIEVWKREVNGFCLPTEAE